MTADNQPPPRIEIVTHWPNDGGESSDMVPEGHTVAVLSAEDRAVAQGLLNKRGGLLFTDPPEKQLLERLANGGTDAD